MVKYFEARILNSQELQTHTLNYYVMLPLKRKKYKFGEHKDSKTWEMGEYS